MHPSDARADAELLLGQVLGEGTAEGWDQVLDLLVRLNPDLMAALCESDA